MKNVKNYKSISLQKISEVVQDIQSRLQPGSLLLLEGEVGSGKTEFLKELMSFYGISEVASPTFSLHHRYHSSKGIDFVHVDLYRIQSEDDLESTGFWDLFQNQNEILLIEWANLISNEAWPLGWKKVHLKIQKKNFDRDYEVSERS